jgi:hypothetical protein
LRLGCTFSAVSPAGATSAARLRRARRYALTRWLGITAWRDTMKSSVAAKQLAFRMTSYNGFAIRRAAPRPAAGPSASPPAKSFEFLGSFRPPAASNAQARCTQGGLHSHLPPATLVNTKLTRAFDVKGRIRRFGRGSPRDAVSEPFAFTGAFDYAIF